MAPASAEEEYQITRRIKVGLMFHKGSFSPHKILEQTCL